jgi:putative transposase
LLVSPLYAVVCRLLELIVLFARRDRANELEILVLRHELSILRRQVRQPRFEPHDRLLLAALSRVLPRRSWKSFVVQPERCCAGIGSWSPAAGPTRTAVPDGRQSAVRCAS